MQNLDYYLMMLEEKDDICIIIKKELNFGLEHCFGPIFKLYIQLENALVRIAYASFSNYPRRRPLSIRV